ncbi:MAG: oxidoreductase domain protein [Nitrospira sp.]|jgi:predicted dehydrogenase|nr:oxidoreductase domain protein [Nitrospira sp.]
MNDIKIGIIGCGWATETLHLPSLRRVGGYQIAAVADLDTMRSELLASRMGIRQWFSKPSQLIEHPDVEAVAICVPPDHHASLAVEAINAGKHVFIEKPMTLSIDQADRLAAAAKGSGSKVLVGFNLRWHRLLLHAKRLVDASSVGSLISMRTVFTNALQHDETSPAWRKDRGCGGGVIHDLAVHHFDLWRFLLSTEVREISASCRSDSGQDQAAIISARMANGLLVSSVFAHGTSNDHQVELYGTKGKVHISLYRHDGLQCDADGENRFSKTLQRVSAKVMALPTAFAAARNGGMIFATYDEQWRHFYDCIRSDAPINCTIDDGRRAVELAVAAVESSATGRPVTMNLLPVGETYD